MFRRSRHLQQITVINVPAMLPDAATCDMPR